MSVSIHRRQLDRCDANIRSLRSTIQKLKQDDAERLQSEYQALVDGLRTAREAVSGDAALANPTLPTEVLEEAVPGNIRKADHFVGFLSRFVE